MVQEKLTTSGRMPGSFCKYLSFSSACENIHAQSARCTACILILESSGDAAKRIYSHAQILCYLLPLLCSAKDRDKAIVVAQINWDARCPKFFFELDCLLPFANSLASSQQRCESICITRKSRLSHLLEI